jgi:hypothetical protein
LNLEDCAVYASEWNEDKARVGSPGRRGTDRELEKDSDGNALASLPDLQIDELVREEIGKLETSGINSAEK